MNAVLNLQRPTYHDYIHRIPEKYHYKLDKTVDFENGDVDVHLTTIADHLLNWEDVAPYLGLSDINISDIREVYPLKPALQRKAALQRWKDIFGFKATYRALLEVCVLKSALKCAEAIIQLLMTPGKSDQEYEAMATGQEWRHLASAGNHQQAHLPLAYSRSAMSTTLGGQSSLGFQLENSKQALLRSTAAFGEERVDASAAENAFRSEYATLMLLIPNSLMLAGRLYSEGLTTRTLLSQLASPGLSSHEKNILILNEVEDQLSVNKSVFSKFVTVLLSMEQLKELGEKLITSYRNHLRIPCNQPDALQRYASFLKAYYNTASVSPDYKWPRTPSTQYVNLAIVKKERVSRAEANEFTLATLHGDIDQIMKVKEPIEFEKVLESDAGKSVKYVVVEGAPGVGKSTFAWELCKQWDKLDALKVFQLVVIVRLRDKQVQMATQLSDLFHHNDKDLQSAVSTEITRSDGDGVLLILDGADELPLSIRTDPASIFAKIVQRLYLPKATLLVTSRPSAITQLVGLNEPEKHVEILGFSEEQIHQYAVSIFGSGQNLQEFERYISSTPAIKGMLYVPLNTAIVIEVYQENKTKDRPIPNTLTSLYTDLCLLLIQRYLIGVQLIKDPGSLVDRLSDLNSKHLDVFGLFISLAEIAFDGILEKQIVFQNFPENIKGLGFTTASAELFTGRRVTHSFLHLTIQEFLAAYFIAQLPPERQKQLFLKHSGEDHLDVVWRFFAGITGFEKIGWDIAKSSYSCNIKMESSVMEISEGSTHVGLVILRCLFEAQSKHCMTALASDEIVFSTAVSDSFNPFDFFALGYCVAHSKNCCWKISIHNLNLQGDLVEMFTSGVLSNLQLSSYIDTLSFTLTPLGHDGVAYLARLPSNILNGIRVLSLDQCGVDDLTLESLAHLLSRMAKLEKVSLDLFPKEGGDVGDISVLLRSFDGSESLQCLLFPSGFHWTAASVETLGNLIKPDCSLTSLSIRCTSVPRQITSPFLKTLLAKSSLLSLKLYGMRLVSPRDHKVFSLLETNTNLQILHLDNCSLGDRGAGVLATALTNNTTLTTLQLNGSHRIFENGGTALSEMLSKNRTLQHLKLSCDESMGTKDFSAARAAFGDTLDSVPEDSRAVLWNRDATIKLSFSKNN